MSGRKIEFMRYHMTVRKQGLQSYFVKLASTPAFQVSMELAKAQQLF